MAAWKLAPALATGNTVVLKPAETTPLTALLLAEVIQEAELPPGVVNIVTGAGETGRRARRRIPTSTRSRSPARPRSARSSGARSPARGKRLTLELGGKAANIVFEDAPLDQAVEGIVNGIFFNQGHVCCAGSRLLVQEPVFERSIDKLQGPHRDAAGRRPARQEHRRRRDQLARAARPRSRSSCERASRRAPRCTSPSASFPSAGSGSGRRCSPACQPVAPHRARGDLRAGALDPDVPHARGGRREGEQHAVRPVRRGVDGEGLADPVDGRAPAGRRRLGEHVQPVRPGVAVRRVQGEWLRPRGRAPRAGAVRRAGRRRA